MHEYIQWIIYNAIMFGSLYAIGKLIENFTWKVINDPIKYNIFTK